MVKNILFLFLTLLSGALAQEAPPCVESGFIITAGEVGVLQSPNYPDIYPNNVVCDWTIKTFENAVIEVLFEEDKIFMNYNQNAQTFDELCIDDYLEIFDGELLTDELVFNRKLCNEAPIPSFQTTGNRLRIRFTSGNNEITQKGFKLTWTVLEGCESSEFRCYNGETCLEMSEKCDGIEQCLDGSDEIECETETSTHYTCGQQAIAPKFKWQSRIVGGGHAVSNSWPWQVLIKDGATPICGGTIIAASWVLTAAHCVIEGESYTIILGAHDIGQNTSDSTQVILTSAAVYVHSGYYDVSDITCGYDIALIQLEEEIEFSDVIQPVCVAQNIQGPDTDERCVITGWGAVDGNAPTGSTILRQARVPILPNENCSTYWVGEFASICHSNEALVTDAQFCAAAITGGIDACQGDSGGPLMCRRGNAWVQYGIVSYGSGCAQKDHFGFYTRVGNYYQWIQETTNMAIRTTTLPQPPTTTPGKTTPTITNTTPNEASTFTESTTTESQPITPSISGSSTTAQTSTYESTSTQRATSHPHPTTSIATTEVTSTQTTSPSSTPPDPTTTLMPILTTTTGGSKTLLYNSFAVLVSLVTHAFVMHLV